MVKKLNGTLSCFKNRSFQIHLFILFSIFSECFLKDLFFKLRHIYTYYKGLLKNNLRYVQAFNYVLSFYPYTNIRSNINILTEIFMAILSTPLTTFFIRSLLSIIIEHFESITKSRFSCSSDKV